MTHEIKFGNPVFHNGLNLTVRVGTKWGVIKPGDLFLLHDVDGTLVEHAIAIAAVTIDAIDEDNLARALYFEHDPKCRKPEGLNRELTVHYGEWEYPLTLVWFWV